MATTTSTEPRINERIRAREVRLISATGEQLGIKSLPDALSLAREQELDLVEIAPMANPPVCKILNYPKYLYELKQRDKEARKKATNIIIKEMKYRPKIGGGDFDTKTRKVGEFLEEGHKVKITIMFRGREVAHPELGMKILNRIAEIIGTNAKMEATPRLDGRNMTMVLAPDKKIVLPKPKAAGKSDQAEGSGQSVPSAEAGSEGEQITSADSIDTHDSGESVELDAQAQHAEASDHVESEAESEPSGSATEATEG